jgi:catechol 2,3-dioxygenase-like lactoylglutathione lyase family enzyme
MLKPRGLTHGHYECRSLDETLAVFTDLLAMQVIERTDGQAVLRHPNTAWQLVVHEAGAGAPDKPHNNHYGVRVARAEEVDAAHDYLAANKERYGLRRISPPRSQHFARSVYFVEPGGNTLEIEHYDAQAVAEGRKIARPHWTRELAEREFPGRGYVPQALTHGTLECDDKEASAAFYRDVLGLEIAGGGRLSVYIKHAATPWYIVVLPIPRRKKFLSPANRFTLTLQSADEVERAHRELQGAKGVTELAALEKRDARSAFLFADLNRNWWEVTA